LLESINQHDIDPFAVENAWAFLLNSLGESFNRKRRHNLLDKVDDLSLHTTLIENSDDLINERLSVLECLNEQLARDRCVSLVKIFLPSC